VAAIILVRHASTAWTGRRYCGRSDPPLDVPGEAAAARLAAEIAEMFEARTRIVSSPSRRTVATALAIAGAVGSRAVALDDRWRETDFGLADGLTFEDLEREAPDLARRVAEGETWIDWPDGERAGDLAARVEIAWREVAESAWDTVVVSHAGPLRIAIGLATGQRPESVEIPRPAAVIHLPVAVRG
jgi:broad specificity phosphatase PhoE